MSGKSAKLCTVAEDPVNNIFKWHQTIPDPPVIVDRGFTAIDDFRMEHHLFHQFVHGTAENGREMAAGSRNGLCKRIGIYMCKYFNRQGILTDIQFGFPAFFIFRQYVCTELQSAVSRSFQIVFQRIVTGDLNKTVAIGYGNIFKRAVLIFSSVYVMLIIFLSFFNRISIT